MFVAGLRDYAGKVAIVTGASSGIGAELARELARRGADVALVARREERLARLAEEIHAGGGRATAHVCDVAVRSQVEASARRIVEEKGRADLLINNAGLARHVLFKDQEVEDMERMVQTNLMGVLYWTHALLPELRRQGRGWIVNFSSFAGKIGQADEAVYSATKFAITGLSEALAAELGPLGIGVLCVHPVLVRTEMFTEATLERMPKDTLKRFIDAPEFVAQLLRALERGETDVVIPRGMRWVPILRSLFPRVIGRTIAKVKLGALDDVTR